MSSLIIKTVIGTIILGAAGIGAWGIQEQFDTRTIEKQLQWEKLKILETEYGQKDQEWQNKAREKASDEKAKAFINRQEEKPLEHSVTVDADTLRKACSKVMSKPNIEPDLEDAKAFCTENNNT